MSKTENYAYEGIAEDWENFENEILEFVTRCKSFLGKSSPSK